MSLREQLADRFDACISDIEGIAGLADYERACELARADECIRQMEWARRECNVTPLHGDMVAWHKIPLTAAPEGWKP